MKNIVLVIISGLIVLSCSNQKFTLVDKNKQSVIVIDDREKLYIHKAVEDLVSDIKKITGQEITVRNTPSKGSSNLIIGTVGQSNLISEEFISLKDQWEVYSLKTTGKDLVIAGSNPRGTMFGIYYFIENYLGVDPFYWWKDFEPEQKENLIFDPIDYTSKKPDFKFRGWFINDEDLLTEFMDGGGERDLDYRYYHQVVHPDLMERVVEAAVRMRYNLIIPASFMEIFNPEEKKLLDIASSRGLYLSQHHIEPLGVSAFGYFNYWKRKTGEKPLFSYYSEKEKVIEVWKESAKQWSQYPDVIWQIGLRGIADRPMWLADPGVPQTDQERASIISDAMQTQMDILHELMPGKVQEVTTTLWGEGAVFNEMGLLTFPENTTIIFADNSPGWVMQEDFFKTERDPNINYGIYYHHGLIGSGPHLAQAVPPSKTHEIFSLAKEKQSDYYAIMNVGNVREFVLGIEASRDMLEDMDKFSAEEWLKNWCRKNFGEKYHAAYEAYNNYFNSYVVDDIHGTPLLLDGLARSKARKDLNQIKDILSKKGEPLKKQNRKQDAFGKSLAKAYPGGQMSPEEWLDKATRQDSVFSIAMSRAEQAILMLDGQQKIFFENNLIAHIKFMQCLTGWVVESTQAVISLENQNYEMVKEHLEAGLEKFELYEEAIELCSRGKWENWYRGEKKIDVKAVKALNEEAIELLNEK